MKTLERIIWIVFVGWLLISYFIKEPKIRTHVVEIPGDSIMIDNPVPYDSLIYVFDTITKVKWLHDTVFLPTDTAAILADYFSVRSYDSIPIQDDSSMTIYASAKVTQNKLYEFNGYARNNRKTIIVNNYQQESYLGVGAIMGANIMAPYASFQKNKHEFGVGYEFYNGSFIVKYGYNIPINLKRYGKQKRD